MAAEYADQNEDSSNQQPRRKGRISGAAAKVPRWVHTCAVRFNHAVQSRSFHYDINYGKPIGLLCNKLSVPCRVSKPAIGADEESEAPVEEAVPAKSGRSSVASMKSQFEGLAVDSPVAAAGRRRSTRGA